MLTLCLHRVISSPTSRFAAPPCCFELECSPPTPRHVMSGIVVVLCSSTLCNPIDSLVKFNYTETLTMYNVQFRRSIALGAPSQPLPTPLLSLLRAKKVRPGPFRVQAGMPFLVHCYRNGMNSTASHLPLGGDHKVTLLVVSCPLIQDDGQYFLKYGHTFSTFSQHTECPLAKIGSYLFLVFRMTQRCTIYFRNDAGTSRSCTKPSA